LGTVKRCWIGSLDPMGVDFSLAPFSLVSEPLRVDVDVDAVVHIYMECFIEDRVALSAVPGPVPALRVSRRLDAATKTGSSHQHSELFLPRALLEGHIDDGYAHTAMWSFFLLAWYLVVHVLVKPRVGASTHKVARSAGGRLVYTDVVECGDMCMPPGVVDDPRDWLWGGGGQNAGNDADKETEEEEKEVRVHFSPCPWKDTTMNMNL